MYKVQQITADPSQQQTLVLPDGSQISLALTYRPTQQMWTANISYGSNFVLNGFAIANNPNLLYQFKNLIPFGLACFSNGSREPSQLRDFLSGYASLYVLSSQDVAAYTAELNRKT